VNLRDDYGIRDTLIHCAAECLPEDVVREMITTLQKRVDKAINEYGKRHHLLLIESLARQIKDAELFEKTRTACWGTLSNAAFIDIARVYLASGDVERAHSWIQKVPDGNTFQSHERDALLEELYQRQGDSEKLTELLFQKFRSYRCEDALQSLLDVIGHHKRDEVIADELALISESGRFEESDAAFLLALGRVEDAEEYLLKRADQLDGNDYGSLLFLAEVMEAEERHLVASLIYRSMLSSILERGYIKAYPHGVRYLKKLDKLAKRICDWKPFETHGAFQEKIHQNHARKHSFWSKYR
jgi:hypothetical protein